MSGQRALRLVARFRDKIEKKKSYLDECPLRVDTQSPVFVFQSLTVLSQLPLANIVPSLIQATERTLHLR